MRPKDFQEVMDYFYIFFKTFHLSSLRTPLEVYPDENITLDIAAFLDSVSDCIIRGKLHIPDDFTHGFTRDGKDVYIMFTYNKVLKHILIAKFESGNKYYTIVIVKDGDEDKVLSHKTKGIEKFNKLFEKSLRTLCKK